MKIRIKGDSIRFRLTKTEVETLCKKGYIEEITHIGDQVFKYAVQSKKMESLEANYKDHTILINISDQKIKGWDSNETVGFETTVALDNNSLHLLLEKDFVCLDERIEDQSDNYPNPKMLTD
ncbi:hypothetical protein [uncultured Muriicola sp.]|uniref:DUF7009 family protein n=1 Tax=uncultured Muriicola sp. TaxID=1583102 RepID=UPI002616F55F|nr:hypothetical protein [uncultured Muriicola sp.]